MTSRRQHLFRAMAWLTPLVFFAVLEGALRIAGFGESHPLFVAVAGQPDYLRPNEQVVRRFFTHPDQAPAVSIDTTYFRREKPAGGLRIFIQGGSTAAGFPYGRWASPAGMLERRIADALPQRDVEVVTTAMSAVNSYTLLDFSDEILRQAPDAIVIYAGHNEYLGILGVGSAMAGTGSGALKRLNLWLLKWRTYQLVARSLASVTSGDPAQAQRGTLMARIAGERDIPLDSTLFSAGVSQFEHNLDALLEKYSEAGVPVFIGTLASNERQQPPFSGEPAGEANDAAWQAAYTRAREALASPPTEPDAAEALLALDETAADAWFVYGQTLTKLDRPADARNAFVRARDLDKLRFRAPSVMNRVVREVAARHGAVVVDVEAAMREASTDGIIGNELMLEHLHPNVRGYFVLADAYYDNLLARGLFDAARPQPDDLAWQRRPVTDVDRLAGEYRVRRLLGDWPFSEVKREVAPPTPGSPIEQVALDWFKGRVTWIDAMNRALVAYQRAGNYTEASRVAINIATAFPFEANPRFVAGQMLIRVDRKTDALRNFHAAASMAPDDPRYLLALARAFYVNGRIDDARATNDRLIRIDPTNESARQLRQQLPGDGSD